MTAETVLTNARIVLPDEIVEGSLLLRDGLIAAVEPGAARTGEDMGGDYIIPGLVELHTDHLEGHYAPRPKVRWNPIAAVLAHDAQVATAGITTVLDALRVGMDEDADLKSDDVRKLADAIEDSVRQDRLRADHFIHLRCEVSAPDCLEAFANFETDDRVKLASLMDHAPGQRQFVDEARFRAYYRGKHRLSEAEIDALIERARAGQATFADAFRRDVGPHCRTRPLPLASHDDATIAHIDEAVSLGCTIAEFPTTMAAAQAARESGLGTIMGSPNLVRGGSHAGNVATAELAEAGVLDVLSSDYMPVSLLMAALQLPRDVPAIDLAAAVRTVTKTPAEAIGLSDRGEIAAGKRADIIRVQIGRGIPVVRSVWREGQRVA